MKALAAALVCILCAVLCVAPADAQIPERTCSLTHGIELSEGPSAYEFTYKGRTIHRIAGNELRHTIWGGEPTKSICDTNYKHVTGDAFGFVVGHRRDMFLGFGVIKEGATPVGLRKLTFYARDGGMDVHTRSPNQFLLTFGNNNDLFLRYCWNIDLPNVNSKNMWARGERYRHVGTHLGCEVVGVIGVVDGSSQGGQSLIEF